MNKVFFGNTVWDYAWVIGVILFVLLLNRIISKYLAILLSTIFRRTWKTFDQKKFADGIGTHLPFLGSKPRLGPLNYDPLPVRFGPSCCLLEVPAQLLSIITCLGHVLLPLIAGYVYFSFFIFTSSWESVIADLLLKLLLCEKEQFDFLKESLLWFKTITVIISTMR